MPDAAVAQLRGRYGKKEEEVEAKEPNKENKPFIVGASFPRTGTNSLKLALEFLGFGKCYHIQEMCENNELPLWDVEGDYVTRKFESLPPFEKIFNGYSSGVDVPFCIFWKEIFEAMPNAKVILSVRDPEKWYESCHKTIFKHNDLPANRIAAYENIPELQRLWDWELKTHWGPWNFANKKDAIAAYESYMEEVKATIPADRLLVFSVKDGWEPLCKFLDCEVPKRDFPHVNSKAEQLAMADNLEKLGAAILAKEINVEEEEKFGEYVRQLFNF